MVAAYIRPKPNASLRPTWNFMHHNLGRLTILCAWATIYTGIYIAHAAPIYKADLVSWLVPSAVVMGLMVVVDFVLTLFKAAAERRQGKGADANSAGKQLLPDSPGAKGMQLPSSFQADGKALAPGEEEAVRAHVREMLQGMGLPPIDARSNVHVHIVPASTAK